MLIAGREVLLIIVLMLIACTVVGSGRILISVLLIVLLLGRLAVTPSRLHLILAIVSVLYEVLIVAFVPLHLVVLLRHEAGLLLDHRILALRIHAGIAGIWIGMVAVIGHGWVAGLFRFDVHLMR